MKACILLLLLLTMSGCSDRIIYVGFPEKVDGGIQIATNENIPVTINEKATNMNLGGYVALRPNDLRYLIEKAKAYDQITANK